jgi:hypothetical protein
LKVVILRKTSVLKDFANFREFIFLPEKGNYPF